nr:retrovirus-related Pol polyprotein from transposon TNT 1-94 [Tanacetum cinerariifolium]
MALAEKNDAVSKEGARNGEWVKISMRKTWLSEAEGFILPNHDTGRILPSESQRNTTDSSVAVIDSSTTDYDSADESSILRSESTFKAEALKDVTINEPSLASAKGNKSSLNLKVHSAPAGPEVVFGDDSTCITEGCGSIKCNGIVFTKFDEKRGTIFNSNKEIVMIAPRYSRYTWVYFLKKKSQPPETIMSFIKRVENQNDIKVKQLRTDNGKFDEKAVDGYLLRYSLVSKAFRVFKTRRQQTEETYHITFDESPKAIKFLKPSVDNINIVESERYPPDEYLHPYEPSQSLPNTKDIHISKHLSSSNTEDTSAQNTTIPSPPLPVLLMVTPASQDRWSQDKHIELVNIIGNSGAGMLTRSMAKQLSVASAHECLFVYFSLEKNLKSLPNTKDIQISKHLSSSNTEDTSAQNTTIPSPPLPVLLMVTPASQDRWSQDKHIELVNIIEEPKKVSEALKHPGWVDAMQDELNQFSRNKV